MLSLQSLFSHCAITPSATTTNKKKLGIVQFHMLLVQENSFRFKNIVRGRGEI